MCGSLVNKIILKTDSTEQNSRIILSEIERKNKPRLYTLPITVEEEVQDLEKAKPR